jgi:hypothetical protein
MIVSGAFTLENSQNAKVFQLFFSARIKTTGIPIIATVSFIRKIESVPIPKIISNKSESAFFAHLKNYMLHRKDNRFILMLRQQYTFLIEKI